MSFMNKYIISSIVVLILLFAISLIAFPYLPEQVASHWNAQGIADDYSSNYFAVLGIPIITLILFFFLLFIPKLDPLKKNVDSFKNYYYGLILMFVLFFFYLQLLVLAFGLDYKFNFTLALIPGFFFLFFYMGVMLKHTKRNYFIGIRTPWALQSDYNWNKTHSFGSKLFVASSIISLFGLIFQSFAFLFLILPIILSAIIVLLYSYIIFKEEMKKDNKKK